MHIGKIEMKNKKGTVLMMSLFISLITVIFMTACQSNLQLKKVAMNADEKPINTPEAAEKIKEKYER